MSKKDPKLNRYTDIECEVCGEIIEGKWDSQVYLGMETGELSTGSIHRWLIYDKHIKCSPSRAQRIVHPKYPTVVDERPQFDWRPEADNAWTDEMRAKYKKLYTEAWVKLQELYNPEWQNEKTKEESESYSALEHRATSA
jgi:hypothetical protein